MRRLVRELSKDQLRAGIAAVALFLSLFLPWYRTSTTFRGQTQHDNLSAFEVFSFVEAAVLLVAAAVLYLLYARASKRAFHLPGGDGWAITVAGGWVVFLLIWRFFDKPDVDGPVGIQWGAFVALAVGAALAAAGQRLRIAHEPEPPNPAEDLDWTPPPETPRRSRHRGAERAARRPVDAQALTRVLRDERPNWDGEPPEPPSRSSAPERTASPWADPRRDPERPATRSSSPTRPPRPESEPPPPPPSPPADEPDRSARPTRRLGPTPPDDDDDALF